MPSRLADYTPEEIAAAEAAGVELARHPASVVSEFVDGWKAGEITAEQALAAIFANFKSGMEPTPNSKIRRPDMGDVDFWSAIARLGAAKALENGKDPLKIAETIAEIIADFIGLIA